MTQAIMYFTLIHYKLWYVALPLAAIDLLYYGPQTAGGISAAVCAAAVLV
jgi:hypothetical protein